MLLPWGSRVGLPCSEDARLRALFAHFDADCDGRLSAAELYQLVCARGGSATPWSSAMLRSLHAASSSSLRRVLGCHRPAAAGEHDPPR